MSDLKVRFAPSPTGPFHIGGARSALFNWLLARKEGGKFLVRIEDTDVERSTRESEENIKAALKWLGMDWDEGIDVGGPNAPYRQSERLGLYQEVTDRLLAEGKAYRCYCTAEELEAEREAQLARGETPKYNGRCSHLTKEEEEAFIQEGRKATIRFRTPLGEAVDFNDMVRGHISFESDGIGDFVIVKSDGMPVYNYCVVMDDYLMGVTDVIRAEEHISNTPRQLVLYKALGWDEPRFGHISLILGKDYKKMSKRHGATAVEQYKKLGYLPEALFNFLALLGWSPEGEEEILSKEEIIAQFSMDRVAKNPAVFDIDKLNWINFNYMKKLSSEELYELCLPSLQEAGRASEVVGEEEKERLVLLCETLRDHISYGAQIVPESDLFFQKEVVLEEAHEAEIREVLAEESFGTVMEAFAVALEAAEEVTVDSVKAVIKQVMKETKLKGKFVYMPIRIALTGQMHGPELPNVVVLLGRETALSRLRAAKEL